MLIFKQSFFMLLLLCTFILLFPTLLGWGYVFVRDLGSPWKGMSSQIVIGTIIVSYILGFKALFGPIPLFLNGLILVLGLFAFFSKKVYLQLWNFPRKNAVLLLPFLLLALIGGSFYPFILDHFGYYVPTIKWLNEYGIIKGISTIEITLGQYSFWHIFQSGFSLFADPFLRINAFFLFIYTLYAIERKQNILLLFVPIFLFFIQSPSPDLPTFILALIVVNEIVSGNKKYSILYFLALFAFVCKPTLFWLPLFVFICDSNRFKRVPNYILYSFFPLLLLFLKNYSAFGYPIFPVQIGGLGFAWEPNEQLLRQSSEMALLKTYDMQYSFEEIRAFSAFDYIKNWFLLDGIKRYIHIGYSALLIAFCFYSFKFSQNQKSRIYRSLAICLLIKTFFVLVFSAQYRFLLDALFVMMFCILLQKVKTPKLHYFSAVLSFVVLLFLANPLWIKSLIPSFKLSHFMTGFSKDQLIKPATFQLNKFKKYTIGNLTFHVVEDYPLSFDTPLPAISPEFLENYYNAGIFPQMIGESYDEGFISKPLTTEQKNQLSRILSNLKKAD